MFSLPKIPDGDPRIRNGSGYDEDLRVFDFWTPDGGVYCIDLTWYVNLAVVFESFAKIAWSNVGIIWKGWNSLNKAIAGMLYLSHSEGGQRSMAAFQKYVAANIQPDWYGEAKFVEFFGSNEAFDEHVADIVAKSGKRTFD